MVDLVGSAFVSCTRDNRAQPTRRVWVNVFAWDTVRNHRSHVREPAESAEASVAAAVGYELCRLELVPEKQAGKGFDYPGARVAGEDLGGQILEGSDFSYQQTLRQADVPEPPIVELCGEGQTVIAGSFSTCRKVKERPAELLGNKTDVVEAGDGSIGLKAAQRRDRNVGEPLELG